jgi:hypothetical protein
MSKTPTKKAVGKGKTFTNGPVSQPPFALVRIGAVHVSVFQFFIGGRAHVGDLDVEM